MASAGILPKIGRPSSKQDAFFLNLTNLLFVRLGIDVAIAIFKTCCK